MSFFKFLLDEYKKSGKVASSQADAIISDFVVFVDEHMRMNPPMGIRTDPEGYTFIYPLGVEHTIYARSLGDSDGISFDITAAKKPGSGMEPSVSKPITG